MKIVETYLPKYTAVFEHPDTGVDIHVFFVDVENDNEPWSEEEYAEFDRKLKKEVWERFNHSGYYHTMTLTAEYVVDGQIYHTTICEEAGRYDLEEV